MSLRRSNIFFIYFLINVLCLFLIYVHASFEKSSLTESLNDNMKIVARLELTDLCLFTDARYTRHPAMADLNTPFQDHPMSLEHFPSGSIVIPPPHLRYHEVD
jgi:hypothetical protein